MKPVTTDMLESLAKKIYVKCVCVDKDYKEIQELNASIKRLQQEMYAKEMAWEIKKVSMSKDITELNKIRTLYHGSWVNVWAITHDDMDNDYASRILDLKNIQW